MQFKDKTDVQLSQIPDDVGKHFPGEELSPQELKLIDRIYQLYPKSFTILLNYPYALFGKNSLYFSLLHRYQWEIEEVKNSKNANIRSIACQQLEILMSFVKLSLLSKQDNRSLEKWHADSQENINYLENHCYALYPKPHCGLIRRYYSHYSFASIAFTEAKTKGFSLNFFKCCGISLQQQLKHFPKDREIVLAAVSQNGKVLEDADASFKSDREVVLAAVSQSGYALQYASENLKNDREIVLVAVSHNGCALEFVAESCQSDRKIVLAAVNQNGRALAYAAENLKMDREIVLAAVSQYGEALQYANESLKSDREVVWDAVKQNYNAFFYADRNLQNEKFLLEAIQQLFNNLQNNSQPSFSTT